MLRSTHNDRKKITMDINLQDVITDLSAQIAQLVRDNAILKVVIKRLQDDIAMQQSSVELSNIATQEQA